MFCNRGMSKRKGRNVWLKNLVKRLFFIDSHNFPFEINYNCTFLLMLQIKAGAVKKKQKNKKT